MDGVRFKQPTQEELDIIVELQSKGYTVEINKKNQEFERSIKYWDKYFKDNQGKIPRTFPKTIFEKKEE